MTNVYGFLVWAMGIASLLMLAACQDEPTPTSLPAPTYTSTPMSVTARSQPTLTATSLLSATPTLTFTPEPAATAANTPTPTYTPQAADRLNMGQRLHRYGDYAAARSELAALLNSSDGDRATRLQARYALARAYLADGSYAEALSTLDQLDQELLSDGADLNEFAVKEQFLRAEALFGQGSYSQAIATYWRFLEVYPWMGEVVQLRIANAYLALGDHASAATAYRRAADAATETVSKLRLLEQVAQAHTNAGDYPAAVVVYDEILATAKNGPYRAEMLYLAGQSLASGGDALGAIERWRKATAEAPASPAAYRALIELVNRNVDFDLYQRGYIDLQAEAYLPAINAFQAYLERVDPNDTRYGLALHGLGQSHLRAEEYNTALAILERVVAEQPTCTCFGQAWLDKALAQIGLGDSVGARRTYRTFARDYAAEPLAAEALWRSGVFALREGNQLEAATDFLTLADAFPISERAPTALYAVALGAYQTGLYSQAVDLYTRLQKSYPKVKWDAVSYWLGRAHQARGEQALAQQQWHSLVETAPDIYYGILAAYALKQTPLRESASLAQMRTVAGPASRLPGDDGSQRFAEEWLRSWVQSPDPNLAALPVTIAEDADLRMGRLLLELDQRGDALPVLQRLFERNQDNLRALYPLSLEFERLGVYRLSIVAAQRLLEFSPARLVEDGPIFLQRHSYPLRFAELIEREAHTNGLDPLLYYSLIRQESLFEEGARSHAAAQGLAQIIPDTGLWVAKQLGHAEYTNEVIYRPHINVQFGAYYLKRVRDDFANGNLISALVGYNAGPGNIAYWRDISGPDDALFVEILNVNEPRLYVQLVTANLYHYTRLYR
jgi:soluble lytic murein transglycosylase